jgi:hypothetical protein
MNTELSGYIENAWHQIKESANKKNWIATQEAFRKMATLQDLDEQSRKLRQRIEGLSHNVSTNGHRSRPDQTTPVSISRPTDSRRRGTIRPRELRIGAHHEPISLNNQITIHTANWIIKQGRTLPKIPNFIHSSNSGFTTSVQPRRLDDGSYMDIGDSQETLIRKARKLLDLCGFDELTFEVMLEDGSLKRA